MNEQFRLKLGKAAGLYPHKLEARYPRIFDRITRDWGTKELEAYLNTLIFDTRGDRQGFPPEVMTELFAIMNYHSGLGLHENSPWVEIVGRSRNYG